MKQTLSNYVNEYLESIEYIDIFKDSKEKQSCIDELAKNSDYHRKSLETVFLRKLKNIVKIEGKNYENFTRPKAKKYSSKLDKVNTKKVEIGQEQSLDKSNDDKKPVLKQKNTEIVNKEFIINNETYESFGIAVNSIIGVFIDNMDDLTDKEKESFGACLKMGFGDMIETHENVRRLFAIVGITGIYTKKIRKARKITKSKKEKLKLEDKDKPFQNKQNLFLLKKSTEQKIKQNAVHSKELSKEELYTDT